MEDSVLLGICGPHLEDLQFLDFSIALARKKGLSGRYSVLLSTHEDKFAELVIGRNPERKALRV